MLYSSYFYTRVKRRAHFDPKRNVLLYRGQGQWVPLGPPGLRQEKTCRPARSRFIVNIVDVRPSRTAERTW